MLAALLHPSDAAAGRRPPPERAPEWPQTGAARRSEEQQKQKKEAQDMLERAKRERCVRALLLFGACHAQGGPAPKSPKHEKPVFPRRGQS